MASSSESQRDRKDIAVGLTRADIEVALREWRESGEDAFHRKFGTRAAAKFLLLDSDGHPYDAKAILFGARRLRGFDGENRDFDGDRKTVAEPLAALGFEVLVKPEASVRGAASVDDEVLWRRQALRTLETRHGGHVHVPSSSVNDLRIFWGGRGIWYDAARTRVLCAPGVTVGVLHTGRHYADERTQ